MDMALGAKIIWRLVTGEREWWKLAMGMNYFGRMNLSRIENLNWEGKGSQMWQLCKATANRILDNLGRYLGNGKKIKILEDKIMGSDPLEEQQDLQTL